jgi:hypothetical protein
MMALSKMTGNATSLVKGRINRLPGPANLRLTSPLDFPWKDMEPGSTFCDIGSGIGSVSLELSKEYSHLKLTLQDQPHILEQARGVSLHHFYLSIAVDDSH